MTIIYAAATVPVNPPGVLKLSIDQLWKGLELKVRKPQLFIPAKSCEVLEDSENGVLRQVTFKDLPGLPKEPVREHITHFKPLDGGPAVGVEYFAMVGKATKVLNIVSLDAEGEMLLTFTFEWDHPEIEAGSSKEVEMAKQYQGNGPKAILSTLAAIRSMTTNGEL